MTVIVSEAGAILLPVSRDNNIRSDLLLLIKYQIEQNWIELAAGFPLRFAVWWRRKSLQTSLIFQAPVSRLISYDAKHLMQRDGNTLIVNKKKQLFNGLIVIR